MEISIILTILIFFWSSFELSWGLLKIKGFSLLACCKYCSCLPLSPLSQNSCLTIAAHILLPSCRCPLCGLPIIYHLLLNMKLGLVGEERWLILRILWVVFWSWVLGAGTGRRREAVWGWQWWTGLWFYVWVTCWFWVILETRSSWPNCYRWDSWWFPFWNCREFVHILSTFLTET